MKLFNDEIKYIPIEKIQPNKINPNRMPDKTFKKLQMSLRKFGMMMPIVVRRLENDKYEIIDGEWRYRASKEIGASDIQAKIIDATEDEVAKLILATTIKGKHNLYETLDIVDKLKATEDSDTLNACNLDKDKVQRRTKYSGSDKIKIVKPKGNKRDEKDGAGVKAIGDYKRVVVLSVEEYEKLKNGE
jgi:hypothetical protein